MGRDILTAETRKCYACGNWEGNRTYYPGDRKIKVDDHDSANCKYWHKKKTGHDTCEQFVFLG